MSDRDVGNLVGVVGLAFIAWLLWQWVDRRGGIFANYTAENAAFAAQYFDGLLEYDAVLASQKWHPKGGEAWECTYAVVSVSGDAPRQPPSRSRSEMGWQFAWGGNWQATPAPPLGESTRNAIGSCASRLPNGLGQRLQTALDRQGSYFVRDRIGETVMIYAPPHGLAARVRFGD